MKRRIPTLFISYFQTYNRFVIFSALLVTLLPNVFAESIDNSSKNKKPRISQTDPQPSNVVPGNSTHGLSDSNAESPRSTHIITMHQMIDGGLASSVNRRIETAEENNASLIIFDIDTHGGRLDSAFVISEYISDIKSAKTVAFISHKAISAGALIAISCNEIIMVPGAELGDCEPIIPSSDGGYKTAGEKIQTVLRTKFRKFAEKNGYPVILSEAMVTSEIEVYRIERDDMPGSLFISSSELESMDDVEKKRILKKKLIVKKGNLLTMHAREAFDYGFTRNLVEDRDEMLGLYNIDRDKTVELETNWSEEMVRLLEKLAPILLTIGIIAIFLEFKAPGFGIPGIVGILCFAAIFLSKYLVGLAETPEIIIFFVGIALIAVEIFVIPGFGVTGIAGIIMMGIGLILSFQDFTLPITPYDSQVLNNSLLTLVSSFLASSLLIVLLLKFMPGIPMFSRLILKTSETADYGFSETIDVAHSNLIGKKGVTTTPLRPAGHIEIDEKTYDVVTQGDFVEKGQIVEIVNVDGNRIIVAQI